MENGKKHAMKSAYRRSDVYFLVKMILDDYVWVNGRRDGVRILRKKNCVDSFHSNIDFQFAKRNTSRSSFYLMSTN